MSELLQFIIVAAFGVLWLRVQHCLLRRAQPLARRNGGVARYNWQNGKWEWSEPPKEGHDRTWRY